MTDTAAVQPTTTVDPATLEGWAARHEDLMVVDVRTGAVLDGGVPGYAAAGGDVVRGAQTWALERQVRVAAGSLALGDPR